jgi:hypothetical protein
MTVFLASLRNTEGRPITSGKAGDRGNDPSRGHFGVYQSERRSRNDRCDAPRAPNRRPLVFTKLARTLAIAVAVVSLAATHTAAAQAFSTGSYYAGPRVWLGNLNGAVALGAQIERGFTQPGKYGPGIIAGGVGIDYYHWSDDFAGVGSYDYSVVPIQVFGNYHFVIKDHPRFDPYLGVALVYSVVSASWSGSGGESSAAGSGTDFAGQAGLRYFMSDNFALQGQLGFGYGTLGLGATWKF